MFVYVIILFIEFITLLLLTIISIKVIILLTKCSGQFINKAVSNNNNNKM